MTANVVSVLVSAFFLLFVTYLVIFPGLGALLAWSRGGNAVTGFMFGLLGPFGWAIIAYRTRHPRSLRTPVGGEPDFEHVPNPRGRPELPHPEDEGAEWPRGETHDSGEDDAEGTTSSGGHVF